MTSTNGSIWGAVIVAAGSGQRFGGAAPKQYAPLAGRPVLAWSLERFRDMPVVVVASPDHAPHFTPLLTQFPNISVVAGGQTRQDSVKLGLGALAAKASPRHVMVHDAARPLVDSDAIQRLMIEMEKGAKAATLAVPVVDTLMRGGEIVDRTGVFAVQTPQAFDFSLLRDAHERTGAQYTDDASLVHKECGAQAIIVHGHADNFKITTPDDLARANRVLMAAYGQSRTGMGYDVHSFGPGSSVRLFGVDMPAPKSLVGHSDADAGLHAIADAILGTVGAGDIGVLFPPSDATLKGMDSARIVEKALEILHARGGILVHADVMLMAEFPRIGPHREKIIARLCDLLKLPEDAVSVKATTTEKLGFIGRGEGLACQAVVTVRMQR